MVTYIYDMYPLTLFIPKEMYTERNSKTYFEHANFSEVILTHQQQDMEVDLIFLHQRDVVIT